MSLQQAAQSVPENSGVSVFPAESLAELDARRSIGRLATSQYRQLLTGMIAQGHGIDALCLFLTLTRDALFDLVVSFGLPTPHDRPYRRYGGPRAWTAADYQILLSTWQANWRTACIAERLGRSKGSIWAKARRLGLPRRERRSLIQPEGFTFAQLARAPAKPRTELQSRRRLDEWLVKGTTTPITVRWRRPGREVNWTTAMCDELAMRKWANQRNRKIADDFGVSVRTITSQANWLGIPPQPREIQSETFDIEVARANIAAARYERVLCKSNQQFPYWRHRVRREHSKRDLKTGFYAYA